MPERNIAVAMDQPTSSRDKINLKGNYVQGCFALVCVLSVKTDRHCIRKLPKTNWTCDYNLDYII